MLGDQLEQVRWTAVFEDQHALFSPVDPETAGSTSSAIPQQLGDLSGMGDRERVSWRRLKQVQAASAMLRALFQFHGNSAARSETLCSAMRASTSASQA